MWGLGQEGDPVGHGKHPQQPWAPMLEQLFQCSHGKSHSCDMFLSHVWGFFVHKGILGLLRVTSTGGITESRGGCTLPGSCASCEAICACLVKRISRKLCLVASTRIPYLGTGSVLCPCCPPAKPGHPACLQPEFCWTTLARSPGLSLVIFYPLTLREEVQDSTSQTAMEPWWWPRWWP